MKLSDIKPGGKGRITAVTGDAAFQRRITAVGMTPGSTFEVIRREKGFPMLISIRNTLLAVNSEDCKQIETEAE
ncbi:MAG: ferrous iron transport protein A [Oscillospiraceae bacterium]|nr:ferrous iron transport protein A [Oscillospiraceae bacterium]MBQ8979067.1 ferrous iron transport protein A [Oscillospiraceae bacterium]